MRELPFEASGETVYGNSFGSMPAFAEPRISDDEVQAMIAFWDG